MVMPKTSMMPGYGFRNPVAFRSPQTTTAFSMMISAPSAEIKNNASGVAHRLKTRTSKNDAPQRKDNGRHRHRGPVGKTENGD